MSYEQFKAHLITQFIERNDSYPNDEELQAMKKLADFAYGDK